MLVLRDLAGIEPLGGVYRALSGARAARGMLRAEARDELPGFKPNDYLDEEQFWGAGRGGPRARALGAARRIRTGDVAHDPKGGECPTWCDLWTMCRVARAMNEQQLAAVEARGEVFVSAGAGTGQDLGARRALRARRLRRGARRRVGARDHLHAQGGRRAARPHPRGAARARAARPRPRARRRLDLDHPRVLQRGCCARIRSRSGSTRASTSSTRSTAPCSAARRSTARSRRSAPAGDSERLTPARDVREQAPAQDAHGRVRDAPLGGTRADARAGRARPTSTAASATCAMPRRACSTTPGATENHVAAAQAALDLPSLPETLIDLAALRTRGARAASFEEARKNVEQAALELVATRDKALLQELLDLFAAEYAGRQGARVGARLRGSPAPRARPARRRRVASARPSSCASAAIMVDEFQDTNALQCEVIDLLAGGPAKELFFVGRRVPVDLRVPACGRRRLPRAPGSGRSSASR